MAGAANQPSKAARNSGRRKKPRRGRDGDPHRDECVDRNRLRRQCQRDNDGSRLGDLTAAQER